jgi:hypothetical protein
MPLVVLSSDLGSLAIGLGRSRQSRPGASDNRRQDESPAVSCQPPAVRRLRGPHNRNPRHSRPLLNAGSPPAGPPAQLVGPLTNRVRLLRPGQNSRLPNSLMKVSIGPSSVALTLDNKIIGQKAGGIRGCDRSLATREETGGFVHFRMRPPVRQAGLSHSE